MNQPTRTRFLTFSVRLVRATACLGFALGLSNCASTSSKELRVSVKDQKAALYDQGQLVRVYGVSTSKYGCGDSRSSCCTPLGKMKVAKKIGGGMPPGMVFKHRTPTGEVIRPNAPGRDPIVTRILWLTGNERKNKNAFGRYIYIHGTPEERNIGSRVSYGCIRMRSMDIIDLYNRVPVGATVRIDRGGLPPEAQQMPEYVYVPPARPDGLNSPTGPGKPPGTKLAKR